MANDPSTQTESPSAAGEFSDTTAPAPSFRQPLASTVNNRNGPPPAFPPGAEIEDFKIQRLLGSGSFARVYLALEVSLDRLVALKVSENRGNEARTLASLEHAHIVQIFREAVVATRNLRLLCMQFVPGLTLERIIEELKLREPSTWNGQMILDILDRLCTEAVSLDLGGLAHRSLLQSCDHAEAVCLLGARLAEALAHAHTQGVIHRDIKPANILVNRYGRPFLADFNIACSKAAVDDETAFGGTLSYMAPEHLDAFNPMTDTPPEAVDARSDVYALGLVLFVFLTGERPFHDKFDPKNAGPSLLSLAATRRAGAPSPRQVRPEVPELVDRLIRRCLQPDPARRFQSAAELMQALEGGRELQQVEKVPMSPITRRLWLPAHPFVMIFVLALIPHIPGTLVNIAYNELQIISEFNVDKKSFYFLVMLYNSIVYPVLLLPAVLVVRRVLLGRRRLLNQPDLPAADAARIRRQALALPGWTVALSAIGWFSGGVVFPLGLSVMTKPIPMAACIHFVISFVISGLIALTYAYFGVQFVVLRLLYPELWSDPAGAGRLARIELAPVAFGMRFFQFLAGLIPLTGAVLLIGVGPEQLSVGFRVLVVALIVLGVAGFGLATMVCNRLDQVLMRLTGYRV